MFWPLKQNRILAQNESQKKSLKPPSFFCIILSFNGEVVIDHRGNDAREAERFLAELKKFGLEIEVTTRSPCG